MPNLAAYLLVTLRFTWYPLAGCSRSMATCFVATADDFDCSYLARFDFASTTLLAKLSYLLAECSRIA